MILKRAVIFLVVVVFNLTALGQTNCPDTATYVTSKVSFGKNSFPNNQIFIFQNDTLRVIMGKSTDSSNPSDEVMVFSIVNRECDWNPEFKQGRSKYKLTYKDEDGIIEHLTLQVEIGNNAGKIGMQYDGEKERIFTLVIR
jgi:hypothetical protein